MDARFEEKGVRGTETGLYMLCAKRTTDLIAEQHIQIPLAS